MIHNATDIDQLEAVEHLSLAALQAHWDSWNEAERTIYLKVLDSARRSPKYQSELGAASLAARWVENIKSLYLDEDPADVIGQGLCCTERDEEDDEHEERQN